MKVVLLNLERSISSKETGAKDFYRKLSFVVRGEAPADSPVEKLPALLTLLEQRSLTSYSVYFEQNKWGRIDTTVYATYPQIGTVGPAVDVINLQKNNELEKTRTYAKMNVLKKTERIMMEHFLREAKSGSEVSYEDFWSALERYQAPYAAWSLAQLSAFPTLLTGIRESFKVLNSDDGSRDLNAEYQALRSSATELSLSPLGSRLALAGPEIRKKQALFRPAQNSYWEVIFNYAPQSDQPWGHVMILPTGTNAMLSTASRAQIKELELILCMMMKVWGNDLSIFFQWGQASGQTEKPLHIHAHMIPSFKKFRADRDADLRFFAQCVGGLTKSAPMTMLTAKQMARYREDLEPALRAAFTAQADSMTRMSAIGFFSVVDRPLVDKANMFKQDKHLHHK